METEQRHDAALLNNLGVESLRRGDFSQAPDLLRNALKETLFLYQQQQQSDRPEAHPCHGSNALNDFSSSSTTDDSISNAATLNSQPESTSPSFHQQVAPVFENVPLSEHYINVYLHTQALYLPSDSDYHVGDRERNAAIRASVMLYNLGLLFHLKAVSVGDTHGSRARLQKALTLYEKASDMMLQANVLPTKGSYSFNASSRYQELLSDFLYMSVLNNVSCAHHQLQDYDVAYGNLRKLVQLIVSLPPTAEDNMDSGSALIEATKSNFLLNAMSLRSPNRAAAAWARYTCSLNTKQ